MKLKNLFLGVLTAFTLFTGLNSNNKEIVTINPVETHLNKPQIKRASSTPQFNFYQELNAEIEGYISNGTLPSFTSKYYKSEYYQIPYMKFRTSNLSYWAGLTEDNINSIMSNYAQDFKDFREVVDNLKVPFDVLSPNQAVGLYFDGVYMNFIWTSEYIPEETFNLQSITVNGKTYNQQYIVSDHSHINGDGMFELTSRISNPNKNIQLNMTPIHAFHACSSDTNIYEYGVPINSTSYTISGFSANLDPILNGVDPENTETELGTEFKIVSTDNKTFDFSELPQYQKNAFMKLSTHCYMEITDIECQSIFSVNFGGYQHCVYFNTPLDLDTIYRVDVNYTVATDEKPWYNFVAREGSMDIAKSLTPEVANGGIFGLSKYKGLSEGNYTSINNSDHVYKYQLFLNYDSDGWNFFNGSEDESKYTNVHNFKMLRMDFLYHGQEIEADIKMDEIEGETLGIFDKNAIVSTDSTIWTIKDTANDIEQTVTGAYESNKSVIWTVVGVVGGVLLLFLILKLVNLIKNIVSK